MEPPAGAAPAEFSYKENLQAAAERQKKWPAKPEPARHESPPSHSRASARQPSPPAARMAKAGGPPRYCPVFCGLKDRCITH